MHKLLEFAARRSRFLLIVGVLVFVLFAIVYALVDPSGFSSKTMLNGLSISASLLMTLESPRQLSGCPDWIKHLAWIVCFSGWLMIPLLVGALISDGLKIVERERRYKSLCKILGKRLGYDDNQVEAFIQEKMDLRDEILSSQPNAGGHDERPGKH